ncbi:hypothetical protein [Curtobacterium sp. B8]|uniref:hypothetical protein n=1 Tax=Curtobacterium sp. B8 TaxID=95611 RepID=UPI0003B6BADE|nr:hypothetical protein [Curtobacterium sp. B8]
MQQRTTQQRAAQPRTAAAARPQPQQRPATPTPSGQRAKAPSGQRPTAPSDEFARLVQRNTVDVRNAPGRTHRRRNPLVGKIALGLAVVCAAIDASAFAVFVGGDTTFAFGICFVTVFLTLVAAVLGFIAAVGSLGRWYGAIGVVVAFLANPVILIVLIVVVAPELLTDMGGSAT